jgi:transcriptional regulator with XRE-family HTH domain
MDYKDIGLRLKQLRGKVSQKDFGESFGVSKSYINNLEHGSKPSLELLISVSTSFDVSLDWIILGIGNMQCTTSKGHLFRHELLEIFDTLTPEVQAVILGTVKAILQNTTNPPAAATSISGHNKDVHK